MAKNESGTCLAFSSIIKKVVMSVTGLFLILFLLFHMSMNLVAVFSKEGYNMICEFLGANWYAIAATAVLAGGFVAHIVLAIVLTLQNQKARGSQRYAIEVRPASVDWASKNMLVLGIIVLGFLGLHFAQFWYKMQFAELTHAQHEFHPTQGYEYIQFYFSQPLYAGLYLVWLGALWFHLTHGFWSAFQTIGWNGKIWFTRLKVTSNVVATIICLGFAIVPIYFFLTSVLCGGACCPGH